MNKLALALSAALSLGAVASASAADATVNFTGEIKAMSCKVSIGGSGATLTLPTVFAHEINEGRARDVPFKIQFGDDTTTCPVANYTFTFAESDLDATGRLLNTGTASNVVLSLRDTGGELNLHTHSHAETLTAARKIEIPLQARYAKAGTDAVTDGSFSAPLLIKVDYTP
ncbi:type 1 fimbrial protein [Stenotrophomonas maltophilia]|uniref:fimbrial protein n=1 Tax=Stenotrophomonas maltophilia TaxID=40324 RepID=UPI001110D060|nr:fimbrial protein [Stenotrophomonas maltophilia]TIK68124.1 type 1 fimbrial protein [Stenotrophomonas maltophilia]TIK75577.1 type 1 fimbrial protein [Stenotrophomonas maltophilia]